MFSILSIIVFVGLSRLQSSYSPVTYNGPKKELAFPIFVAPRHDKKFTPLNKSHTGKFYENIVNPKN